jgi:hypothetical protein
LRWNGWRAGRQTPGSAASLDVHHAQRGIPTRPSAGKQEQSEGARGGLAALLVRGFTVPNRQDHEAVVSLAIKANPCATDVNALPVRM